MKPKTTSDGRYIVVNGRRWRATNPNLPAGKREKLVRELMKARRDVKAALNANIPRKLKAARAAVQKAKVALGERGPPWWKE